MLHPFVPASDREADALEDLRDRLLRDPRRNPIEPRRVGQVLLGRHLLEERRLDRDAVDEPLDRARLLDHVVAEDRGAAPVGQQQRREQADKRRLARAVLTEDRDALATLHRERDALESRYAPSPLSPASARRVAAEELLAQIVNFNGEHDELLRFGGTRTRAGRLPTQAAHGA